MKYCQYCGGEIHDEAVICIHCGRAIENKPARAKNGSDTLLTVAKVFMIIACVAGPAVGLLYGSIFLIAAIGETAMLVPAILTIVFCCVPLAWTLPMTLTVSRKIKAREPIGTALKVCALLFVSLISGILLLCHNDEY